MKPPSIESSRQPFPPVRPEIIITPSRAKSFSVNCRRMPGFGVPLDVGASSWMAWYDPPNWRLTSVSHQRVVRNAEIHGLEGVEVEMLDWDSSSKRWRPGYTHYARLTDNCFEWLAVSHVRNNRHILTTFLDEGFDRDWGRSPRLLHDTGLLTSKEDGSFAVVLPGGEAGQVGIGAGMFTVRIGKKRFNCLRVIGIRAPLPNGKDQMERTILTESYYSRAGDLVLFRRYNGRLWETSKGSPFAEEPWDQRFPDNANMVVNGAMFVHWYDCLTDVSCGL